MYDEPNRMIVLWKEWKVFSSMTRRGVPRTQQLRFPLGGWPWLSKSPLCKLGVGQSTELYAAPIGVASTSLYSIVSAFLSYSTLLVPPPPKKKKKKKK